MNQQSLEQFKANYYASTITTRESFLLYLEDEYFRKLMISKRSCYQNQLKENEEKEDVTDDDENDENEYREKNDEGEAEINEN